MIGVLFATVMEADPFIAALEASAEHVERSAVGTRYSLSTGAIALGIVGMGKSAAADGTSEFVEQYRPSVVVNAGIAGALDDSLTLGAVYRVSTVADRDTPADPPLVWQEDGVLDLPAARLVTSAVPVFSAEIRAALRLLGEMVDMEGVAVGRVCAEHGVSIVGLKCISDFAGDGDRVALRANLARAAATLSEVLMLRLNRLPA